MHNSTSTTSLGRKRTFAEELEGRRERNRSHAKKSRQRKKAITELLQESIQSLQQTNQVLRGSLVQQLGPQYSNNFFKTNKPLKNNPFWMPCIELSLRLG